MDSVEADVMTFFGEEEAESYRQEKRQRTTSACSETTFEDSELSEAEALDESCDSESSFDSDSDEKSIQSPHSSDEEWIEEPVNETRFPLTGCPGILIPEAANMTPINYFKLFFNVNFLTTLANMTNAHAKDILDKGFKPESRLKRWKDTNADELLKFLGVLFFMGTVRLNKINNYWAKSHLVKFNLTQYMSRNRFLLILRMLYFEYSSSSKNIYTKVEYVINYFNEIMQSIVYPEKELIIDESLVLRGRLRQFIKYRRNSYRMKIYILTDPNGVVHRIHMHTGAADSEVDGAGHVEKVVLKLLKDFLNAGHSVYMDNFYNSIDLAQILLKEKTYCTGILHPKRKGNPVTVTSKKLSRGRSIYRKNSKGVCVMKWNDIRDVLTLSTEHTPELTEVVTKGGRVVPKPEIIINYKKCMKGVYRHDYMLAYYPCEHKAIRWYKKIAFHVFQTMFINAYFLYKAGTGKTLPLEMFREQILLGLLPPMKIIVPMQFPGHMPRELERNCNGVIKRRKCARCWNRKKRKDSGMFCPDCNVGLCIECYGLYHFENQLLN